MIPYYDSVLDAEGNPAVGSSVHVYTGGTTNHASIFSNVTGTPLGNPIAITSAANFKFWAQPGYYDITVTGPNITTVSTPIILGGVYYREVCGSAVAANSTTYLSPAGDTATIADARGTIARTGNITQIVILSDASPSSGQSFNYTLNIGGIDSQLLTISGTSTSVTFNTPIAVSSGLAIYVKLVTSATATVTNHRVIMEMI